MDNDIERTDDGAIVGYKWLQDRGTVIVSPAFYTEWGDDGLEANAMPTKDNAVGIHAAKRPDSPELLWWSSSLAWNMILVKLELTGTVVEHETGYRAQHARVLEVLERHPPDGKRLTEWWAAVTNRLANAMTCMAHADVGVKPHPPPLPTQHPVRGANIEFSWTDDSKEVDK